ncbi:MAG: hypothetical protein JRD19_07965 [Deltaproteobacteria bacterium]|jgi:hypothetical protein|nr:hypothetical protein [Deltaproteobacteria bacterium]
MEKLSLNYHLRLQEMCDCYMETDYLPVMQGMAGAESKDPEEDAIKYLALAIMFAITEKAKTITFKKKGEELTAKIKNGGKRVLPVPSAAVLDKVFEIMRTILHIEEDKGEMEFSLGLRSGEVNVKVKVAREDGRQTLKIKFSQK